MQNPLPFSTRINIKTLYACKTKKAFRVNPHDGIPAESLLFIF